MPRPLQISGSGQIVQPAANRARSVGVAATGAKISLKRRSSAYVQALRALDVSAQSVVDLNTLDGLIDDEFRPVIDHVPLGWVSRCYLGAPYEVHHLDMAGRIVAHCKFGEPLPGPLERARQLALNPYYALVEVYPYSLVAIRDDGSTTEIEVGND